MTDPREALQRTLGSAYTLERELGGGGMSRVYLAQETSLGRPVVLKVIAPELAEGLSAERFAREVKLAARLQQANIVPVLTAGDAGGLPYYTMPYVKGESLRARLASGQPMPLTDTVGLLRDVARALAYAHSEGVVHRDIKPENILLSGGTAVVTDFGIAKAISASRTQEGPNTATLTQVGNSIGTPAYMAPEQAAGAVVDQRADIYAWGVVAYELLAGRHPFGHRVGAQQMIAAHITETPALLPPSVPPELAALVLQSLEKNPERRPLSADELVARLSTIATTSGERVVVPSKPISRGIMAGAAAAILLTIGGGWYFERSGHPTTDGQTVVVLPFENLGATEDAYFADGVSDEIASQLARIPGMMVVARASVQRFKGSSRTPQDIAQELGASYALSGTVRWARSGSGANGNTVVRIVPALVRSSSGEQIWGEPFQEKLTDVFAVQTDVAERVALALSVKVGKPQQAALRQTDSRDPEARDAQLLGRSLLRQRGVANLRQAIVHFRRAIERDSNYARAWAGYSLSYGYLPIYLDTAITWARAQAEAELGARRAVALDRTLPESHMAMAQVEFHNMRFARALASVDRSLALDPSNALAHKDRGEILLSMGRTAEAEAPFREAAALDPLVPVIQINLGVWYMAAGRMDSALAKIRQVIQFDPDNPYWHRTATLLLLFDNNEPGALAECLKNGNSEAACHDLVAGALEPGQRNRMLATLGRLGATGPGATIPPLFQAILYAKLGESDSAFARLRLGLLPGNEEIYSWINSPWLAALKRDPRWDQIVGTVQRQ